MWLRNVLPNKTKNQAQNKSQTESDHKSPSLHANVSSLCGGSLADLFPLLYFKLVLRGLGCVCAQHKRQQ